MISQAVSAYVDQLPLRAILAEAAAARMVDRAGPHPEGVSILADQLDPLPG